MTSINARRASPRTRATPGTVAETIPYAWPWDGVVDLDALAVLTVRAPGPLPDGPWRTHLDALVEAAHRNGVRVIEVITHPPGADPVGDSGLPADGDLVVRAQGWSGFFGSPLDATLNRLALTHLVLAGHWLEIGVHSTMRAANDRGYECLLAADACASFDPLLRPSALSSIEMSGGIFGAVGASPAIIDALNGTTAPAPTTGD